MLADRDRAGEADLADDVAADQRRRDEVGLAVDELRDPGGDAGVGKRAEQFAGAARGFLRRAADHRAARGERGGDLLGEQIDGEIPRREGRGRPDRLADDDRALAGRADERAAIVALDLLGIPIEHRRRADDFGLGLGERLALLLRQDRGDVVGALAQQVGGLVEDRASASRPRSRATAARRARRRRAPRRGRPWSRAASRRCRRR